MARVGPAMDTVEVSRYQATDSEEGTTGRLDLRVLGVCSGSRLKTLDFALVRYRQEALDTPLHVELLQYDKTPIPASDRIRVLRLRMETRTPSSTNPRVDVLPGHVFSSAIQSFCTNHNIDPASIHVVGLHTRPLRHFSEFKTDSLDFDFPSQSHVIAADTGITTVYGFSIVESRALRPRVSPVAFVDRILLRHPTKFRACLSISEIVNISFIPVFSDDDAWPTISRDCGPGNLLIDYAMRYWASNDCAEDCHGTFAAQGNVNQRVVDRFLKAHDYLYKAPSMRIAIEMFGDHEAQWLIDECILLNMSQADTIATITRITAQNIVIQYRRMLELYFSAVQKVDEVFICGSGARNSTIINYFKTQLPESVTTKLLDDIGIPGEANEAVCFAHLALEAVLGQATQSSTPLAAGSTAPNADTVRGEIVYGAGWDKLLGQVRQFSKGKPLPIAKDVKVVGDLKRQ